MFRELFLRLAFYLLQKELKQRPPDGNSLYHTVQSYLAMAYYEKYKEGRIMTDRESLNMHYVANEAAKDFLNAFIEKKVQKKVFQSINFLQ